MNDASNMAKNEEYSKGDQTSMFYPFGTCSDVLCQYHNAFTGFCQDGKDSRCCAREENGTASHQREKAMDYI
jgi:hypothetical protein